MQARLFSNPSLEQHIKNALYNTLADYIINVDGVSRDNLPLLLQTGMRDIIQAILQSSALQDGIRLHNGVTITNHNCPDKYLPLFHILLKLKSEKNRSVEQIDALSRQVMALESFRELNPTQFLLEAKGLVNPIKNQIPCDEGGVTAELIRNTFYNEMVVQTLLAIQNEWLTIEDLETEEPQVYLALPALTIFEAIQKSQYCDGIRLLSGKVVNERNCPHVESFPELVKLILSVKNKTVGMSAQQLLVFKQIISCEKDLPEHLRHIKTPELMASVAVIKDMSIEITRRQVFHGMIGNVLKMCLETLKPAFVLS